MFDIFTLERMYVYFFALSLFYYKFRFTIIYSYMWIHEQKQQL